MPPNLKLGDDGLQPYRCIRVLQSKMKGIIEGSLHTAHFLAVVDSETGLCRLLDPFGLL
jgi:hypothetical protein